MTLKLTEGTRTEILEVARITTEELASRGIEVQAFDHRGAQIGRFIVIEEPTVSGMFTRAYLMEQGKTIETIRQQYFDPRPEGIRESRQVAGATR